MARNGAKDQTLSGRIKIKTYGRKLSLQYNKIDRSGNRALSPDLHKVSCSKLAEERRFAEILSDLADPKDLEKVVENPVCGLEPDFSVYHFWAAEENSISNIGSVFSYGTEPPESGLQGNEEAVASSSRDSTPYSTCLISNPCNISSSLVLNEATADATGQKDFSGPENLLPDFSSVTEYSPLDEDSTQIGEQFLFDSQVFIDYAAQFNQIFAPLKLDSYEDQLGIYHSDESAISFNIRDESRMQQREIVADSDDEFGAINVCNEGDVVLEEDMGSFCVSQANSGNQERISEVLEVESFVKLNAKCKRKRCKRPRKQKSDIKSEETSISFHLNGMEENQSLNKKVCQPKKQKCKSRRGSLPSKGVAILQSWLDDHFAYAYPSNEQKQWLIESTGMTPAQVSNWLANSRHKLKIQKKQTKKL